MVKHIKTMGVVVVRASLPEEAELSLDDVEQV